MIGDVIAVADTVARNPAQTVTEEETTDRGMTDQETTDLEMTDRETTDKEMIEVGETEVTEEETLIDGEIEMTETKDVMRETVMIEKGMTEIRIMKKTKEKILAKTLSGDQKIEETDKVIAAGESQIDTMIKEIRKIMKKEMIKEILNVRDHVKEAQFQTKKGIRDLVDKAFIT